MSATELTCWSCIHQRYAGPGIRPWCAKYRGPALHRCTSFSYDPGSDEAVRDEATA